MKRHDDEFMRGMRKDIIGALKAWTYFDYERKEMKMIKI